MADVDENRRAEETPCEDSDVRLRELIGETLRDERLRQGRTLADVADDAAVSLPYLSEVERGRKEVSSDLLHSIHHALDLELEEVLERSLDRLRTQASAGSNVVCLASARLSARAQSGRRFLAAA